MSAPTPTRDRLFRRPSWTENQTVTRALRTETVGGAILLVAAVAALVWANSPAGDSYARLRDLRVGPEALHMDLSLGTWAADGLLAVFFFVGVLISLVGLGVSGGLPAASGRVALLLFPAVLGGMLLGALLRDRIPREQFRVVVLGLCAVSALALLARAVL